MGTGSDLWNRWETLQQARLGELKSLFTDDAVHLDPTGRHEERETIVAYFEGHTAFTDVSLDTSLVIEQGDTVVAEWTYRATHTGPLALPDGTVIPATGKKLEVAGLSTGKVSDGNFASVLDYYDLMTVMSQLGLMPMP